MTSTHYSSCKNLVNINPVVVNLGVEHGVEHEKCTATGPQFDDRHSFGTLAFRNGLEYRNFHFNRLIGNYFYTLCRNSRKI